MYFQSFSFVGFSNCPIQEVENIVYNANSYTFEACFDKDVGRFSSSQSKNPTKNVVGEPKVFKLGLLSLQFDRDRVLVCVCRSPLKWELDTPIYRKMHFYAWACILRCVYVRFYSRICMG